MRIEERTYVGARLTSANAPWRRPCGAVLGLKNRRSLQRSRKSTVQAKLLGCPNSSSSGIADCTHIGQEESPWLEDGSATRVPRGDRYNNPGFHVPFFLLNRASPCCYPIAFFMIECEHADFPLSVVVVAKRGERRRKDRRDIKRLQESRVWKADGTRGNYVASS